MNYHLLTSRQIQPIITKSERVELNSMLKVQPTNASVGTVTPQSSTAHSVSSSNIMTSTSMSDLTDDLEMTMTHFS